MASIIRILNIITAEICGWMMSVVMFLLLADVLFRTFATPIMGVAELAMFVMIGTVYAGLANCEMERGHVRVSSVVELFPPKLQRVITLCTTIIAAITIGLATWAMCANAWASFIDKEGIAGAVNYLLYPVKFIMSLGMILYLIQIIVNFFAELTGKEA
ncbi:MAG: hypothetical protein CSA21_00620 [Deltaproteobacteria bacterium]|nr:MAG: hypothetical protein CSA21_00620 [Deltaproteobacteria bacterium]